MPSILNAMGLRLADADNSRLADADGSRLADAEGWPQLLPELHAAVFQPQRDVDLVQRLERARRMLDAQFVTALRLEHIARSAALSPFHFARMFRKYYGETPHQYLTNRRLERAGVLLQTTDLSMTKIALEVGFDSPASFSRCFAQHKGYPPSRHRRRFSQVLWAPLPPIPWCFRHAWSVPFQGATG